MFFDAFELVDGDDQRHSDDRRIELREWMASYERLQKHGFVGLQDISEPAKVFQRMDADGKGMVLLVEFCTYLKAREIDANTPTGKLLGIGDESNEEGTAGRAIFDEGK